MNKTLLAFSLSLLTLSAAQASEWGYGNDKHGPEHWGEIAKDCATTKNQSPINIDNPADAKLEALNLSYTGQVIGLTNNGHTLQAQVNGRNSFTIDGELAVISVMFDAGDQNAALSKLINAIPQENQTTFFKDTFEINDLLPKTANYYRFNGSLTTPPCSEGVRWFVLKDTQTLSKDQAAKLMEVMGQNNRPLQPLNARVVLSN
ncbi:carbonic anhydrase family protein [Vibrio alginolyticus]|nr:carbonic anhydrase family protein [Vibrio alginolyticus]